MTQKCSLTQDSCCIDSLHSGQEASKATPYNQYVMCCGASLAALVLVWLMVWVPAGMLVINTMKGISPFSVHVLYM
jgi:hypothetical protein